MGSLTLRSIAISLSALPAISLAQDSLDVLPKYFRRPDSVVRAPVPKVISGEAVTMNYVQPVPIPTMTLTGKENAMMPGTENLGKEIVPDTSYYWFAPNRKTKKEANPLR